MFVPCRCRRAIRTSCRSRQVEQQRLRESTTGRTRSSGTFVPFECRARISVSTRARRVRRRYLWRRRRFLPIGCGGTVGRWGPAGWTCVEERSRPAARAFHLGACAAPVALSQCTRTAGARTLRRDDIVRPGLFTRQTVVARFIRRYHRLFFPFFLSLYYCLLFTFSQFVGNLFYFYFYSINVRFGVIVVTTAATDGGWLSVMDRQKSDDRQ